MSRKVVAIVGRPNVGKSTLFNRMIRERKAIVDDRPGVTRDRLYASCQWNRRDFLIIDTGGFVPRAEEDITAQVSQQVLIAIEQADVVLFLLDARVGMQTVDEEIARELKRNHKKVIVAANKADSEKEISDTAEFFKLGLGQVYPVSAANGRLVGDLLDAIVESLPAEEAEFEDASTLKVAIVGRPNVGK
jgi:GTPase